MISCIQKCVCRVSLVSVSAERSIFEKVPLLTEKYHRRRVKLEWISTIKILYYEMNYTQVKEESVCGIVVRMDFYIYRQ